MRQHSSLHPIADAASYLSGLNKQEKPALEKLFGVYYRSLYLYLQEITGDRSVAEEIANDTFLKLWDEAPQNPFQSLEGVWAFLRITARNAAINYLKKASRDKKQQRAYTAFQDPIVAPQQEDYTAIWSDVISHLYTALKQLPEQQREVMRLNQQGLNTREIAKRMNLSPQTVRNHRSIAIQTLKDQIPHAALAILLYQSLHWYLFR